MKSFRLDGEGIFDEKSYRYSALLSLFKGKDWSYKKEWRIIYPKSEIYTNNYNVFEKQLMRFDCVSAIYLGYRTNSEVKENLIEIVQRKNQIRNKLNIESIKVYEMSLYKDSYKLKPKEIEVL